MNSILGAFLASLILAPSLFAHSEHDHHHFHEEATLRQTSKESYQGLQEKNLLPHNITNIHQGKREIALTIDDGPTYGANNVTARVLDILKKYQVKATFFLIGEKIARADGSYITSAKNLLDRMILEGHIVANHTISHENIGTIGFFNRRSRIRSEILSMEDVLRPWLDKNSDWYYFRAPGGSWQERAADIINETPNAAKYKGPLFWDIGGSWDVGPGGMRIKKTADWKCWSEGWRVSSCLKGYIRETEAKLGGVVLFHDLKMNSADLLEEYLAYFTNAGYKFITLDEIDLPH